MPAIDRIELLQRMPIFGALRDDTLGFLIDRTQPVRVLSGDYFFREGDPADGLFVLESGQASVLKGWDGHPVLLRHLHAGDCFGEMALMDLQPRSASVRALEPCSAIEFGTHDMLHLYETDVEQFALMQMHLGRELCRRLRATDERLFRAAMGEVLAAPPKLAPR